jgi:hypothetical protein
MRRCGEAVVGGRRATGNAGGEVTDSGCLNQSQRWRGHMADGGGGRALLVNVFCTGNI